MKIKIESNMGRSMMEFDSRKFEDSELFVTFLRECGDFLPDDVVEGIRRSLRDLGDEGDGCPTV
jgi:hypothetical protein